VVDFRFSDEERRYVSLSNDSLLTIISPTEIFLLAFCLPGANPTTSEFKIEENIRFENELGYLWRSKYLQRRIFNPHFVSYILLTCLLSIDILATHLGHD
jgi:hypothetical protein